METPALTLNRLCGSGLQAIVSAAQAIMLGDADVAVAGGAESMSRGAYWLPALRWGARMNATQMHRHDGRRADRSVRHLPHGRDRRERGRTNGRITARSRTRWRSRATAAPRNAIEKGYFKEQILPIEIKSRKGTAVVRHRRARPAPTSRWKAWRSCGPVFNKDGTVTAGNASGINDGAAAVVLMERERRARRAG